ncbi:unnamed protein product [Miscanthus lutarioriparius]|uniref:Uncharacterized protein n=1 Tax=Miscanthus lutarioriparius TaxID=422564 RepID=A0A811NW45_9POAL|nr:unnamed protein product [Miscanthus lutarioriparius]
MASMKFDLLLLDYKMRFALWQVKMRAILAQSSDLDEALDGFGGKGQKSWTAEEKRKDRKALSLIQLHLHNDILQEVLQEKIAAELWLKLESICMSKDLTNTILLSHDELTLAEVYEALQTREKMKGMVQSDVLSSKGKVLQVRGRPEQKTYNNNNNRDKSKNGKGRSKSRGRDKFCRYCKKDTHVIEDCWKLQNKEKRNGDVLVVFVGCVAGRDKWILDSTCSFHICSNRDWFSSYKSMQSGDVMRMEDNNPREIVGIGSVQIKMHDGMICTLKDVRHIPGMTRNLISLSTLDAEGYRHSSSSGVCKVSKGSLIHMIGDMNSAKLYVLRGSTLHGSVTVATVSNDEPSKTNLWHMRLGHMSELGMAELIKRDLLDGCTVGKIKFCEHCVFGKHKRVKFNASVHTTKGTLDYVHANLWGPSRKPSYGGARYMITIIDDYSRKVWPYFLKNKDDTFAAFKEWKVMIERQTEKKLEPRAIKRLFLGYGSGVKGYKLWNPKTKKTFMSRNVVFNESVVFNDSLSTDVSPFGSNEEQEHVSMQVEHVDDQETEIVDNNVHDIVQHSPPILQPQNQFIVDRRTKRSCGPRPRLIEECDIMHYAFSCAEQVENIHELATYTKAVVFADREKWISAMQEEMQSLEKNGTWDVVRLPKHKKCVSTPIAPHFKLSALQCASTDEDFEYMSRVPYSSAVGSLMYAMVCSRPDLSYAMSLISRYMADPGKEHWKVVQWIFRYLRGTTNACLKFDRTGKRLTGYVDSDFVADLDKRRSLTGYVFTIGGCASK